MRPRTLAPARRVTMMALTMAMLIAALPAIALAAIPNDHPEQATVVTTLPFVEVQDTSGATDSPDDPECAGGDGHSVWFSYTPDDTIDVFANTFGSDYDTTLSVYTDFGGELIVVACNDDWEDLQSQVFWTAQAGVRYLIMVGAFGASGGGNLTLTMDEGIAPPPPPEIDVTVTATGGSVDLRTGKVTIRGEIVCSEPAIGFVSGEVRQRVGRQFIYGWFDELISCDVEPTPWVATTYTETGVFTPGPARVSGVAIVFDGAGGGFFEAGLRLAPAR